MISHSPRPNHFPMNTRLLALALVSTSLSAFSAAQDTIFSTVLPPPGTGALDVVPTEGGGMLVVSNSTITALGATGAETGRIVLPGRHETSISAAAADGRGGAFVLYVDATQTGLTLRDGVLLRTDKEGATLQFTRIGGTGNDIVHDVVSDGADGAFVAGRTSSPDFGIPTSPGANDAFVARLDAAGGVLWVERIGDLDPTRIAEFRSVAPDGMGGVLVGGATTNAGFTAQSYEAIAVRFDASGGLVWNRVIPDSRSRIIAVERTSSGGYVELQAFVSGGYACSIRDAAGALVATVDLDPASMADDEVTSLVRLEVGTFALGGRLGQGTGGRESHLLIFDEAGSRLSEQTYPTNPQRSSGILALASDSLGSLFLGEYVQGPAMTSGRARRVVAAVAGSTGCAAQPNSTGSFALTRAIGSPDRATNELVLLTTGMPLNSVGYYLGSQTPDLVPAAGGSQGDLCLGGSVGRFSRSGEVQEARGSGRIHLQLDLADLPSPTGSVSAMAGETWYFQAWYRDLNPTPTSNFSSSTSILLE